MFLPYGSFGAMMNFMRAMMLLCCALAFSAHAEIPVSNSFDHVRTGYMLRDVHASLMCEQCHVDGIFKNTPRDCAGCHTLGSRVGATPKPINHVQSNKPCDVCHTSPTSFQVKNFSHAGFATNCASCHNGQSSGVTSKPSNHFPTVLACETCHLNTATFTSTRMNHAGIASNCAQCHGGQFPAVVGKTATHIVTTGACESCHNASNTGNFSTFQGARYGHNAVAAGSCATCHNGGTAIGKTASHIATTAACDVCHTVSNTNNYASFQGAQFNHSTATPAVTGICSTCHSGATATGKPTFHITTTAQCDSSGCHTSSTTQNFTTFVGATFTHSTATPAVASRCSTCHGGQSPSVQSKNATHIPTTAQCDVCHTAGNTANYTSFQGASFAHSTATPSVANRCSTCHGGQSADVTSKHATHIATTVECDVCHTASNTANYSSFQGATFAHSTATPAVANRCSACHGGQSADVVSKPASHFATTAQCDVCHTASNTANYTSFQGASFAHSTATPAVANRCSACHGGQSADVVSKPASHFATTAQCDVCHTASNTANYTSFQGAIFAHSTATPAVANRCSACHGGQSAGVVSKPASHVATTAQCDICHTASNTGNYATFTGAPFNHIANTPAVAGICSTCHNGTIATGKSSFHTVTSAQCDSSGCHTQSNTSNYTTFLGALVNHAAYSPPVAGRCSDCHNGTNALGKPTSHISTTSQCDQCHTASNTANYNSFTGATFNHSTATPAVSNRCSSCHGGQSSAVKTKPALHIATTAQCDSSGCHSSSNTQNYTTFTGATFNHSTATPAVAGRCSTCHNGTNASGKTSTHFATTSQCDSSGCHSASNTQNYTTFTGATFNHSTATPAVAGTCSTCHDGQFPGVVKKPALHIATTAQCDSSGCHSASNTQNYTTFTGATFSHITATPAVAGRCSTCHNGTNASGKTSTHFATTSQCDSSGCHSASNTQSYTTFTGATFNHGTAAPAVAGRCSTCHGGQYPSVLAKPALHMATTAQCDSSGCHTATTTQNYTTFAGAAFSHATASPAVAGRCSTCHNGVVATGKPNWHMATVAQCDSCHTASNTSNYTTFTGAAGSVDHSAYGPGSCYSGCHNGASAKGLSAGHIPTGTLSCDGCHAKFNGTSVVTFSSPTMNHTTTASIRCDACHNGSYTTQGNNGGALGKMTNHIPTTISNPNDCTTCHTNTTAYSTWSNPISMNHNGAKGGGVGGNGAYCVTCHLKGVTYQGGMDKKSHEGTSMSKDCSKSGCHKPLGSKGVAYSAWD